MRRTCVLSAAVLGLVVGAVRAQAGVVEVTDFASLAANDAIHWGQLGPDFTALPRSVGATTAGGLAVTARTRDSSGLLRIDEGGSWIGNFSPGDKLLNNNSTKYSPLTIMFATPVFGAGADIQLDGNQPFTATIRAFDGNRLLGTFTEGGVSTQDENGSAIFIGVKDTNAEITRIVFGLSHPPKTDSDFAIDSLRVRTSAVPEPSSLILLGLGGQAVAGFAWRWKAAN
jgi:hypothetical protein